MTNLLEVHQDQFTISTDPTRLEMDAIVGMLERTYWATGRPREKTERAFRNSLVFGVYEGNRQIGMARVVTDFAIFAYLCDVFIHEDFRARGLGKWLMQTIMNHPDLVDLRRWLLVTSDAHSLYRQYGFSTIEDPERWMQMFKRYPQENA